MRQDTSLRPEAPLPRRRFTEQKHETKVESSDEPNEAPDSLATEEAAEETSVLRRFSMPIRAPRFSTHTRAFDAQEIVKAVKANDIVKAIDALMRSESGKEVLRVILKSMHAEENFEFLNAFEMFKEAKSSKTKHTQYINLQTVFWQKINDNVFEKIPDLHDAVARAGFKAQLGAPTAKEDFAKADFYQSKLTNYGRVADAVKRSLAPRLMPELKKRYKE